MWANVAPCEPACTGPWRPGPSSHSGRITITPTEWGVPGFPTHKLLYDAAGIDRGIGVSYDNLLESLMITQRVPAWAGMLDVSLMITPEMSNR